MELRGARRPPLPSGTDGRWMSLLPKMLSGFKRIDFEIFPPLNLIPGLMKLSMVAAAKRHCELIADLKTDGSRLSKPQMMRITRLSSADQARLGRNELQVCLVA